MFNKAYRKCLAMLAFFSKAQNPSEPPIVVTKEVSDFLNAAPEAQQIPAASYRRVPIGVRNQGFYDDRVIPGGADCIGMIGAANGRLEFPLSPEETLYFKSYYRQTFGVEPEVFDKFVEDQDKIARLLTFVPKDGYARSKPTAAGRTAIPLWAGAVPRVLGGESTNITPEELQEFLQNKLTPQLVIDNTGSRIDVFDARKGDDEPMV